MAVLSSDFPLHILIVEDEPMFAAQLREVLTDLSYHVIGPALDAATAAVLFQHATPPPDIAILDIHLGQRSSDGIELARVLLAIRPLPIIFFTSQDDTASFERARAVGPAAYLIKPTSPAALQRTIELAIANFALQHPLKAENEASANDDQTFIVPDTGALLANALFIKENGILVKVSLNEISWVMAEGKYCQIALGKGRVVQVRQPLRELSQHLPSGQFVQIQRSYLINAQSIERIDPLNNIVQVDGHLLPIGLLYRDKLLERLHLI